MPEKVKRKTVFQLLCEEASKATGVGVEFYQDNETRADEFQDDGCLHIRRRRLRACFDVGRGQSLNGFDQNENTRSVLKHLAMADKITERVLVDEDDGDDEDDTCPCCGRPR